MTKAVALSRAPSPGCRLFGSCDPTPVAMVGFTPREVVTVSMRLTE